MNKTIGIYGGGQLGRMMAQAALHLRLRSLSGDVPEALNRPLPWQRTRCRAFSNKHEDTEHRL